MEQSDDETVEISISRKPGMNDLSSVDQEQSTRAANIELSLQEEPSQHLPSISEARNVERSHSKKPFSDNMDSLKQEESDAPLEKSPKDGLPSTNHEPKRGWGTTVRQVLTQEAVLNWAVQLPFIPLFNPGKDKPQMINSQTFSVGKNYNLHTRWKVQLCADFWYKESMRTVAIYIWRLKDDEEIFGPEKIHAHYKLEILDRDDNPVFCRENGIRVFEQGACYGWKKFVSYSDVLPYIYNKRIRIRASVKIMAKSPLRNVVAYSGETVDVKWKDSLLMTANTAVLKTQCSLLFTMIKSMPDGKPVIQLESSSYADESDENYPTLINEMLIYMHEGTCPLLKESDGLENKIKLFELAFGYAVEGLTVACVSSICDNITAETAARVAILAKTYDLRNRIEFVKPMNTLKKYFFENLNILKQTPEFMDACDNQFDKEFFTDLILSYLTNPDLN